MFFNTIRHRVCTEIELAPMREPENRAEGRGPVWVLLRQRIDAAKLSPAKRQQAFDALADMVGLPEHGPLGLALFSQQGRHALFELHRLRIVDLNALQCDSDGNLMNAFDVLCSMHLPIKGSQGPATDLELETLMGRLLEIGVNPNGRKQRTGLFSPNGHSRLRGRVNPPIANLPGHPQESNLLVAMYFVGADLLKSTANGRICLSLFPYFVRRFCSHEYHSSRSSFAREALSPLLEGFGFDSARLTSPWSAKRLRRLASAVLECEKPKNIENCFEHLRPQDRKQLVRALVKELRSAKLVSLALIRMLVEWCVAGTVGFPSPHSAREALLALTRSPHQSLPRMFRQVVLDMQEEARRDENAPVRASAALNVLRDVSVQAGRNDIAHALDELLDTLPA